FRACGGEDYELGYRLLRSGVRFVVDRSACARHYKDVTVRGVLRAKRHEARSDVLIAKKHPELIGGLPLASVGTGQARRAAGLAMYLPWIGDLICVGRIALLRIPERLRLRRRWERRFNALQTYAYWRGLRDSVGSLKGLRALRWTAPPSITQKIDVARPL